MKHSEPNVSKTTNSARPEQKQSQKFIVIGVLAVLAVIIVVSLVVLLKGCSSSAPSGTNGEYAGSYSSPNSVLGYSDGEIPTTGSRHDVTVSGDGGPQAMDVIGNWRMDSVTVYKFDGYGRGVMCTDVDNYTFAYTAVNGHLYCDFDVDDAMDSDYTYVLTGDILTLTRGKKTFKFTKEL